MATRRLLARAGFFDLNEFVVKEIGDCFHSFELHPALLMSRNQQQIDLLLDKSKETGETIESLVKQEDVFSSQIQLFKKNLKFNLEMLLTDSMITDRAMELEFRRLGPIKTFADGLSRFLVAWELMQPFFGLEGFVGSAGISGSKESGILDVIETMLPGVDTTTEKGKQIAICLASIVECDFEDVEHVIKTLRQLRGKREVDMEVVLRFSKELRNTELNGEGEIASFFNSFINFQRWMRLRLKAKDKLGDSQDSVCIPGKFIANALGRPEISSIVGATTPKGIAAARFIEESENMSSIKEITSIVKKLKQELRAVKERSLEDFVIMDPEDPFFPNALVGGKAQGLKSLKEAIKVLKLDLNLPKFVVISRIGLEMPALLIKKLKENDFSWAGIARSSAIGEDSHINFAGVFESVKIEKDIDILFAIKEVVDSFKSDGAKRLKLHAGIPEDALGGVVLQERVAGKGIVLFINDLNHATLTFAETPVDAVNSGGIKFKGTLDSVLDNVGLKKVRRDLALLFSTFGPIDLELVKNRELHVVQMRRIAKAATTLSFPKDISRIEVQDVYELPTHLQERQVVRVNSLLNFKRDEIADFILNNQKNIAGFESLDNENSHIANLVMGLGVPFREIE